MEKDHRRKVNEIHETYEKNIKEIDAKIHQKMELEIQLKETDDA